MSPAGGGADRSDRVPDQRDRREPGGLGVGLLGLAAEVKLGTARFDRHQCRGRAQRSGHEKALSPGGHRPRRDPADIDAVPRGLLGATGQHRAAHGHEDQPPHGVSLGLRERPRTVSAGWQPGVMDVLHVDCASCRVRGPACADCVISVLLGPMTDDVHLDDQEQAALAVMADSGLLPPLRLVVGQ